MTAHPSLESVGNPTAIVRNTGHGLTHVSGSWLGLIAAVFLLAGGSTVLAQTISDDFNDGNDVDWLHMDLTKLPPPYTLPGAYVSYSFPDDGAGGKAYRIWAKAPPPEYRANVGPARTYSYRSPNFGRMRVSVDVLDWDTTANQVFGVVVRGGQIGLGETDGYVVITGATVRFSRSMPSSTKRTMPGSRTARCRCIPPRDRIGGFFRRTGSTLWGRYLRWRT